MNNNGFPNYNYYQPYQSFSNPTRFGGLRSLFSRSNPLVSTGITKSKFSFSNMLNTTQKTLNVINQAIPIYNQVKPMLSNAKTMFKIMGALKDDKVSTNRQTNNNQTQVKQEYTSNNSPRFFL